MDSRRSPMLPPPGKILDDFLRLHTTVQYIRLQWVDLSGIQHTQFITTRAGRQLAQGATQYLAVGPHAMLTPTLTPISTAMSCVPSVSEDWELRPDWESLRHCSFAPKHASVMCDLHPRATNTHLTMSCPRTDLRKAVSDFQYTHETDILIGFEAEFVLLDDSFHVPTNQLDPTTGLSTMSGLRSENLQILEEIVEAVESVGIEVHKFHTEGTGQYEIVLAPRSPLASIDGLMFLHEAIRTISMRHGLKATLSPNPTLDAAENIAQVGCHMHISLNPVASPDCFLAGILRRMTALCAIGMPNYDSYTRVAPHGAGVWIGWGTENRDFPIRRVESNRWELRFVDATANMYLVLHAVLASGSDGITQTRELTWQDVRSSPDNLTREELASRGVERRMPTSLSEALAELTAEEDMKHWIGEELVSRYLGVKEAEVRNFAGMSDEDRRQRLLEFF